MKVASPFSSSHNISFIPRFYGSTTVNFILRNEATNVESDISNTYTYEDGIGNINFTFTFKEAQKFQMTIKEGTDIVFRGKLIATNQLPQEYRLTEGYYTYEP